MRGMASEFRGHVDEMVRQSELDEVKKQLTGASDGLDLKSLDPTQQIRQHVQEGMAEGEKAFDEAKTSFDNPLAEPESAPQIAAEPAAETTATETTAAETATAGNDDCRRGGAFRGCSTRDCESLRDCTRCVRGAADRGKTRQSRGRIGQLAL